MPHSGTLYMNTLSHSLNRLYRLRRSTVLLCVPDVLSWYRYVTRSFLLLLSLAFALCCVLFSLAPVGFVEAGVELCNYPSAPTRRYPRSADGEDTSTCANLDPEPSHVGGQSTRKL